MLVSSINTFSWLLKKKEVDHSCDETKHWVKNLIISSCTGEKIAIKV